MQSISTIFSISLTILFILGVNLPFKPAKDHRFVHSLARINPLKHQVTEGIRDIDEAPPGMLPLESSPQVEGLLCLFKNIEENEDRSVSQKEGCHKQRRQHLPKNHKHGRIRGGRQEQDHSGRSTEHFQENEQNEIELQARDEDEKKGKDEGIQGEGEYLDGHTRRKKEKQKYCVKEQQAGKVSHDNDVTQHNKHPDQLHP